MSPAKKGLEDKPFLLMSPLLRGHLLVFRGHVEFFWGFLFCWSRGPVTKKAIADAAECPCRGISSSVREKTTFVDGAKTRS